MKLTEQFVLSMKNHPGDYVEDVEELAEDWFEMKKTLEWIKENSKDENVLKQIKKILEN